MRWVPRLNKPLKKVETCKGCYDMKEVSEGTTDLDTQGWCEKCRDKFDQAVLAALPTMLAAENGRDQAVAKARKIAFTFMDLRKSGKSSDHRRPKY